MTYNFNNAFDSFVNKKSRIYFLVKDAHWTFIWWVITQCDIERALMNGPGKFNNLQFTLRVHDVTDILFNGYNSHRFIDIDVTGLTDHWYFNISENGRNYLVEAGFKKHDNSIIPIIHSNTIFLPTDISCPGTEIWKTVENN